MAAEVQAAAVRGKVELALGLIGVIDNLERALAAVGIEPGDEQAPAEPLAEGFFLTYRELCAVLGKRGSSRSTPPGRASTRPGTRRCRRFRSRGPSRERSSRPCRRATGSASSWCGRPASW